MFFGRKKKTKSREILVPRIEQVMFLTFLSYSINILSNYLIFLYLTHFAISRKSFLVIWYSDPKTTEYLVLLVFIAK